MKKKNDYDKKMKMMKMKKIKFCRRRHIKKYIYTYLPIKEDKLINFFFHIERNNDGFNYNNYKNKNRQKIYIYT